MTTNCDIFVVAGLGNPGASYDLTRHNIGFELVDSLARMAGFDHWRKQFSGLVTQGKNRAGKRVYFLKPQTYMNKSGDSVRQLLAFYKIPIDRLIVVHDDLDLLPGQFRCKTGGGAGGHNGLKSLDAALGAHYHRLRLGIGRPPMGAAVNPWVLGKMNAEDRRLSNNLIEDLVAQSDILLTGDLNRFANKVHSERQKRAKISHNQTDG